MNSYGVTNSDTKDHFPKRNAGSELALDYLLRNSPKGLKNKKIHRIQTGIEADLSMINQNN